MGVRDFAKQRKEKTQAAYASPNLSETRPAAAERPALTGVRAYAAQKNKNADAVVRPFDAEKASQMLFETSEAGRAARAASLSEKAAKKAEREDIARTQARNVPLRPEETAKLWITDRQNGTKLLDEKQGKKHHIDMMSYDVDAAKARLEELKKQGGGAVSRYITAPGDLVIDGGRITTKAKTENAAEQHKLEREIEEAERYQKAVGYAELPNRPDFDEKSKRTAANDRYDKAVYNDGWYSDKQRYIDDLKPEYRTEYEKILAENGEAEADKYLMRFYNDEGGYFQKYLEELSDDEKRIFNYILNTEGGDKAEEYLKFLDQTLTYRSAVRNYERAKEMSGAEQHLYGFFNDIDSGITSAGQGVLGWLTDDEIPYTREQMENSMFLRDQGNVSRAVHSAITSTANMLPSMAVGIANPAAGKALFFASAGGNARQEALRAGYTAAQATRYGALNGAAEVFLEDALGGIAQLGGKGLSNVLGKIPGAKAVAGKIGDVLARISVGKQTAARFAAHTLDNLAGEFTDEYLQEILDPVFRNICLGEHNEFKPFTEEALFSGIVGALMAANSGILNLPADIYDARMSSREAFSAQKMRDVSATLIENTSGIQREDVVKARETLKQKIENRESINFGDIADYTKTLQEGELMRGFGVSGTEARTADDVKAQLGDAANGDAVAVALYQMQIGKFSERDAETVRNSPEGRALFSEYFDTDITENTSVDEISAAVRDVSGDDYRSISYEAQQLLKSVRASNGYSDGADAAFYRAYFEGYSGKARSDSKRLSNAALVAAYQMGVDAKKDIGTFHTVGGAALSKETTAFFSRTAKDLGLSITYGGKGSVKNGGVRRGYANSYSGIHIYEDAKVKEIGGKTLVGGDAAARIILGHELTHILQKQSPTQYKAFETFALQQKSEQGNKIGLDLVSEYMQSLRLDKQSATDEVVANYAMRALFSDMKTARVVTKHHTKVAEAIRRAFAWIREKLGIRTSEIDRASAMWNKAYSESRKNADAAVAEAVNRAKGVANSADAGYNGIKNSIAQNNAKLIRYFTGEVRESGDVYLSGRDKTKIAHNVKSGNGWMHKDGKRGWVYTDVCFYTFEFNADHSVTVTEELFLEDDADRIKTIRKEFSSNGYATTVRGNDQTAESKEFRPGVSSKHSLSSDNGRKIGRTVEVHGQESGSGRIRSDRRGGSNSKAISEASEKQNKVKADSAESAFSVGEVKDSIATPSTDSEGIMKLDDANIDKTKEKMTWLEANDLLEKQQGLSYRFYASDDPMSRAGYAMFADDHEQNGDAYGGDKPRAFSVREDDLVPVWELSEKIAEARHETDEYTPWILEDYAELSDEDFADMFNPSDIVDSAYAWDNEELTEWFYNHVAEPNKIGGVKTSDGAIVFDKDLIRRNIPAEIVYTQASSNEEFLAKYGDDTEADPDIRYSVSSTDAIDIDFERRLNAARGRQTSVSEVLRRNEKEARAVKREFLPDMKTVGEVARSFAEIGLAKDATTAELVKATTDAAVAMRAAYLERRIANEATKDAKSRTAAKKLIEAAEMVKLPEGMSKTQVAAAMADALYQTNTSDRKTVKELVAQYGAIKPGEKPSRTLSVPKRTDEGRNVSEAVRTVLEARVTPDGMVPTIEDAIESGDFSYETITDKASLARAKSKIRRGYQVAYDDFRSAARRGNVSKDQITLGFELYNQAANAGTEEGTRQAMEILADIVSTARSSGQTLAAMRLLKKMSPDGQLYTVQRTINRINESIGTHKKRQLDRARATVDDAMWNGREDAAEEMARSIVQMGQGLPVEEWVDAIGNLVGDGIAARLSPKTKAERLVSQNIKSDILQFAEDYLPRAAGERKNKTAAERLSDYFANKDNYEKAWERAKASIREKYADNPDALAQFDAFLVGTLSNNVADSSVMLSAIAKAAISEDSSIRQTALRATLGDADGVALDIYNRLNQTVQAVGDDAVVLRDAILRYVRETAAEKATPQMVENEIRRAVREAGTTIGEIIRSDTLERTSVLRRIQSYLIENLGISADAAGEAAETIRQNFTKMTEEKSRAALEATLKDKPRSVRKTAEERFREYANLGAFEGEYNEAISKKLFGETVRINEKLVQKFRAAETEEQRTKILKDIYRDIGRQIPSTWLEKWTAWRYLSMLFNLTTHIRNVVGNAGFAPIVMAKNKVALGMEALYGLRHKDFEKNKAFLVGHGDLVKAADADFSKYQEVLFEGEKYRDTFNGNKYIDDGRHIFRDTLKIGDKGVLNHLYDFNRRALSAEDMVFKKQYYVYALASWCKTHGITAEQVKRGEGLDAARAYAIREAQRNTYNDANAFSDLMTKIGHTGNKYWDTVVSGAQPFLRTPANITARGLEYSPAGLLWTITRGTYQLRNGEISAAQYIDNLAQGLTGSIVVALGWFLAHLGIIGFGGDDDKEKDFAKMYGHQQYSIEIGGKSITLDWLAPESIPFFTGVNMYELMQDGGFSFEDMQQVLELITDPMLNMSMLQGISDMIDNAKWSNTNALGSVAFGIAENLISQNLPTVLGKFERITQPDRMTTYVDKNQPLLPSAQRALGKLSQKFPGLDYNQIPYIDAWGEKETNTNAAWRAFDQLMNPAYTATVDSTPLEQEIIRLHRATGKNDMFPTRAQKSFTVKRRKDGKPLNGDETKDEVEAVDFNLTADQYVKYATYRGKASKRIAEALIKSPYYKQADDATQREMFAAAYDVADAQAKMLVSDYRPDGWVAKAISACKETGITEMQYITLHQQNKNINGKYGGESIDNLAGARKMQMLYKATLSDAQRAWLADDFDVGKTVRGWDEAYTEKFLSWYKEG
jgi:hypothetical protein